MPFGKTKGSDEISLNLTVKSLISRRLLPPSLTEHVEFACKPFVRLKNSPPGLCFILDTRKEMGKMKLCTLKTHFQIKLYEKLLPFRPNHSGQKVVSVVSFVLSICTGGVHKFVAVL